jgi:uncharacterized protein
MTMAYVDTSALAKWYLDEERSDEVYDYLKVTANRAISSLTLLEMHCLLSRKQRNREVSAELVARALATFKADIRVKHFVLHAITDQHVLGAVELMAMVPDVPLRTLDAIHLNAARTLGAEELATADSVLARAARQLDFQVIYFGRRPYS